MGEKSGGGGGHRPTSGPYAGNQRILDPIVVAPLNVTKPADAAESFQSLWDAVATGRDASPTPQQWGAWWDQLMTSQERVAPLTSQACAVAADCLGTSIATGDCICKMTNGMLV